MIRSMTAYASTEKEKFGARWLIEIHTVNRKMLDIHLFLPKELFRFDIEIRKWVAQKVSRGQVTVRITKNSEGLVENTLPVLRHLKKSWEKIAEELGYEKNQAVTLEFLSEQLRLSTAVESLGNEEEVRFLLEETIGVALLDLIAMKETEGEMLLKDIQHRLNEIALFSEAVKQRAPFIVVAYKKKLEERLKHLDVEEDERLLKELVIFAEKVDITEEVVRLQSHIKQFNDLLISQEQTIGRTLDFLTQEMNREINTMAAKSVDSETSLTAVKMKGELEKIREQVQNIE